MKFEDVSDEELERLNADPEVVAKRGKAYRVTKKTTRDLDTWYFGGLLQEFGKCDDPDCPDPRGKDQVMTIVIDGKRMCRFSFLNGYGL
jgi:hypothetical protein